MLLPTLPNTTNGAFFVLVDRSVFCCGYLRLTVSLPERCLAFVNHATAEPSQDCTPQLAAWPPFLPLRATRRRRINSSPLALHSHFLIWRVPSLTENFTGPSVILSVPASSSIYTPPFHDASAQHHDSQSRGFAGEHPPYAILSHRWGEDEVTFQDLEGGHAREMVSYSKIDMTCSIAAAAGLEYAWIDTCCIDKTSSAELSEAINSMYRWYQEAVVCYAFLATVHDEQSFWGSDWFNEAGHSKNLLLRQLSFS